MIISVIDGEQLWLYLLPNNIPHVAGTHVTKLCGCFVGYILAVKNLQNPRRQVFRKHPQHLLSVKRCLQRTGSLFSLQGKAVHILLIAILSGFARRSPLASGQERAGGGRAFAPAAIDGSVCRPAGDAGRLAAVFPETRRISFQNWENIFPVPAFSESQYIIRMERCP